MAPMLVGPPDNYPAFPCVKTALVTSRREILSRDPDPQWKRTWYT